MRSGKARPPYHKRIRLDPAIYAEPARVFSITIGVKDRCPVFADPVVAAATVEMLRERAAATGVTVHGYCVMPDHVHVVLSASPTTDVITFVGQFKNLTQRATWRCGIQGKFWQKSFWDRALRTDEGLKLVVEYVLNNPVRRGLVDQWRDYPFAGSLAFEV